MYAMVQDSTLHLISNRLRAAEMAARNTAGVRLARRREALQSRLASAHEAALVKSQAKVNAQRLRPDNSYSTPDYVLRGYYVDRPFTCRDCGKPQVWTGTQQKWWYETAGGGVWTMATRCRVCRRRERERRDEARRVHREGVAGNKKRSIKTDP